MTEFRLPSLGADMDEGMLVAWRVSPGDTVHRGQVIAEVESDKGIIEVECWEEGVIATLLVEPGPDRLAVGTPLATFAPSGDVAAVPEVVVAPAPAQAAASKPVPKPRRSRRKTAQPVERPVTKPPIRHLAHELGVDLAAVTPTGPNGSVTRDDVRRTAHRPMASPMARQLASEAGVDLALITSSRSDGLIVSTDVLDATGERVAKETAPTPTPTGADTMRAAIARAMARSKREIPHYYVATHIDLGTALAWLEERNADRPITGRILPAVLLLKAAALALGETPDLNGWMIDDAFRRSDRVHLGVAVSLRGGGLVAPAIHDVGDLDLDGLMEALRDLVARARSGRLRSSEMSDASITVTNLGDRGVETTFPVIIPPQVAIVGFGKVSEQPVAIGGMLAVRPVVHATLAADHRVTDGHLGGLFLEALDRILQAPDRL